MSKLRSRLTYANLISTLSLFLVLSGGVAYAASHLPKNSVGPRQLRKSAVNGAKVKDGSLTAADFDPATLARATAPPVAGSGTPSGPATTPSGPSSATPSGPAGGSLTGAFPNPEIADGAITAAKLGAGIPGGVHVVSQGSPGNSESRQRATAECPAGEQVIGGGAISAIGGATGFVALESSGPAESSLNSRILDSWTAVALEVNGGSTQSWSVRVWAICAQF
jgi:hypothetical protein